MERTELLRVRLSPAEKARLKKDAASADYKQLGPYVRHKLFGKKAAAVKRNRRTAAEIEREDGPKPPPSSRPSPAPATPPAHRSATAPGEDNLTEPQRELLRLRTRTLERSLPYVVASREARRELRQEGKIP